MRFLLYFTFFFLSIASYAQKASQKASKEICQCIESKLSITEQEHVKDSINHCFGNAMAHHREELFKEFKMQSITVENVLEARDRLIKVLRKKCVFFKEK